VLELNRVERLYTGGKLLDRWQGLSEGTDGHRSEELLVTTTEYIGHSENVAERGLSRTKLDDGSYMTLKDMIRLDEAAFLGKRYAGKTNGQAGVLARVGDSTVRLVIQVHPDRNGALKYLNFPSGKTEVWFILDSRRINGEHPYVYAGFQPSLTRQKWRGLFETQDIEGLLSCLHKIQVAPGDAILIEAGMPHAIGGGCLFLELHEACDYTIRLEKTYLGVSLTDEQLHYGIGFDAMFDLFRYETYTPDAIHRKVIMPRLLRASRPGGTLTRIVSYDATDRFAVDVLALSGSFELPHFDGHYIAITARGDTELRAPAGTVKVPQGRGVFVPANVREITAVGDGELVIAYPFIP